MGGRPSGLAGGIGFGLYSGGFGSRAYVPWVGGEPFFHHKKKDDEDDKKADETTNVDCDALVDPSHPGHREAVTALAHVDEESHKTMMQRIRDELDKL
jgi:hypothetical protein